MTDAVWVTGASGFTGRHMVEFLRQACPAVRVIAIDVEPQTTPDDVHATIDLNDSTAVMALAGAERPRWVIHLAGVMPPAADAAMWRSNVGGTVGLLIGLAAAGCAQTRVVCVGSAAEYARDVGNPISESARCGGTSAYGNTKLAQTITSLRLGADNELDVVVARPFNLVGPGMSGRHVLGSLVRQFAVSAPVIQVGNTHTARDFVDVRDVVGAYWLLATRGRTGEIYNVSSATPVRIGDLMPVLQRITGHTPAVQEDATRLRSVDQPVVVGDSTKLRELTGWQPQIALEQSIRDMLAAVSH